jgi:hypothetical protein
MSSVTRIHSSVGTIASRLIGTLLLVMGCLAFSTTAGALTLVVDDDGQGTDTDCNSLTPCFLTISAAVLAASPGDVIVVCPGTYAENVTINKQLTLQGAQSGVAGCGRVVGAPNPAVESILSGPAPGPTLITLVSGSAGTIVDGFSFIGATRGLESATGPINNVVIRNNHFAGFTSSGIFLNDPGVDVTVDQNNVDGSSKTGGDSVHLDTDLFNGFHLTRNCIVNAAAGSGFFVDGAHNVGPSGRTPLIDGNRFENSVTNVGANLGSRAFGGGTISNNIFRNNGFDGLQGGIQNTTISGNLFDNNGRWGLALTSFGNLAVDRGGQNCVVTGNTFTANDSAGYFISATQAPGNAASNSLNNNDLVNNGPGGGLGFGAIYRGSETIDVECNWWGHANGPDYPPANPNPPADGLFATSALYSPWLNGSITGSPQCELPTPGDRSTWGTLKTRYR